MQHNQIKCCYVHTLSTHYARLLRGILFYVDYIINSLTHKGKIMFSKESFK